jgi:hypothetical protein
MKKKIVNACNTTDLSEMFSVIFVTLDFRRSVK